MTVTESAKTGHQTVTEPVRNTKQPRKDIPKSRKKSEKREKKKLTSPGQTEKG